MKKNLNKILLEAINRGINLALDGFEDLSDILSLSHGIIKSTNITQEYLDLMEEFVDLCLPSGTLWANANLGATCDNTIESWYGNYYSFGDPQSNKNTWTERNYNLKIKHKYDYLDEIKPEDDLATLLMHIHNFNIHIPTKKQCEELIANCEIIPQNGYKQLIFKALNIPMGLNGYIVKSKINGNEIFIPSAGYYFMDSNESINDHCSIQSNTVYGPNHYRYYGLMLNNNTGFMNSSYYRTAGLPIRPVCNL